MTESDTANMEIKCELDSISIEDVFSECDVESESVNLVLNCDDVIKTGSNEQIVENRVNETNSNSNREIQYNIESVIKCDGDSLKIENMSEVNSDLKLDFSSLNGSVENNVNETNSSSNIEIQYNIESVIKCDGDNLKIENMSEVNSNLKLDFSSLNGSVVQHLEPSEIVSDDSFKSNSELKYEIESVIGNDFVSPIKSETSEFKNYDFSEENNSIVNTPLVVEEIVDIIKVEINNSQVISEYCEENNNEIETNLNSEITVSNEITNEREDDIREAEEENYEREEKIQRLMLIDTQQLLAEKQSEEEPKRDEGTPKEEETNVVKCYEEDEDLDLIPTWRSKQLDQSTEEYYLQEEQRQRLTFWDYVGTDFLPNVSEIGRKRTTNSETGAEVSYKKLRS